MKASQVILDAEDEYIRYISVPEKLSYGVRFRDSLIPDMYDYNYTCIFDWLSDEEKIAAIQDELKFCTENGEDFCRILMEGEISGAMQGILAGVKQIVYGCYIFDITQMEKLNGNPDASVKIVNNKQRSQDLLSIDLSLDGDSLGGDFCRRRAERHTQIYLSDCPINSYICYCGNEPVGSCDLTVTSKAAKIENFCVKPDFQRRGFGTAMLKDMITRAYDCGALVIYLLTDEAETAKEMYIKNSFAKTAERAEIFFEIGNDKHC